MKRTYSHIDMDERRKIVRWRMAGLSVEMIAEKLGRRRSTIFREIKRNTFVDEQMPDLSGYYCVTAHDMACERRAKLRKLSRFSHVRQSVVDRIIHGWSPQQIAGRMRLERHPTDVVADRKQFGHWECDLIQFRKKFGKANVTSLVERVSRFAIFLRNNDRQSRPVMDGLIQTLQALPHLARRSITFDRGTEFTDWPYLQASIGTQTWFCDPQSPWQKGTVENTNGRVQNGFRERLIHYP